MKPHLTLHTSDAGATPPAARRVVTLPGTFAMRLGGKLQDVRVAYESWGVLTPSKDNVLLLFTGLSPSAHAASKSFSSNTFRTAATAAS